MFILDDPIIECLQQIHKVVLLANKNAIQYMHRMDRFLRHRSVIATDHTSLQGYLKELKQVLPWLPIVLYFNSKD